MNSANLPKYSVIFQPMGVRTTVGAGQTLRAAARDAGVEIESLCGERINCGKCKITIRVGNFARENIQSDWSHVSEMEANEAAYWKRRRKGLLVQGEDPDAYRLSCQARVLGDLIVEVPESSRLVQQVVRKSIVERQIELRPSVRKLYVELAIADVSAPLADWERAKHALIAADALTRGSNDAPLDANSLTIDMPALRELQRAVREGNWRLTVTVWRAREVIRVEPGYSEVLLGLAVDVGTTTIAGYLCDLHTAHVLATESMMNRQIGFGEDIISRMAYAAEEADGLERLQRAVLDDISKLARRAARQAGVRATDITDLVIVGNSAMHHILLGLDTRALSRAPYVPAAHAALNVRARDVGIKSVNSGARVFIPPLVASFVGADAIAALLSVGSYKSDEHTLLIDVGTNAELMLVSRTNLVCTSTPTGPAFEGAHIEYGMRAAEGAIERVCIDDATLRPRFKVIGSDAWSDEVDQSGPRARGICGSGIIDAVAELFRVGLLEADGKFTPDAQSPNLLAGSEGTRYVLAWEHETSIGREIPITLHDVRQIQLAKAPLYVAAKYLLNACGLERPDRILLTGGFGSYIEPLKAMLLGMIPDTPLERVHSVSNAAGDGARLLLLNTDLRQEATTLLKRIRRIELPAQPGFQDQFILALHLPHMNDPFPSLDGIAPVRQKSAMAARLFTNGLPKIDADVHPHSENRIDR